MVCALHNGHRGKSSVDWYLFCHLFEIANSKINRNLLLLSSDDHSCVLSSQAARRCTGGDMLQALGDGHFADASCIPHRLL